MGLRLVILCLLTVLLVPTGQATPVIGTPVTFDVISDPLGWSAVGGDAFSVTSVDSGDLLRGGYLQIQFDVGPQPNFPQNDQIQNFGSGYVGDYSGLDVSFDYLGFTSSFRELYFVSVVAGATSTWTHSILNTTTNWETLTVSFASPAGWSSDEHLGDQDFFMQARTNVALLGFYLQTPIGASDFVAFGIDNLEFNNYATQVPEPSTVILLVSVVLCLCVTFRVDRMVSGKIR